jgi:hypothetical protein
MNKRRQHNEIKKIVQHAGVEIYLLTNIQNSVTESSSTPVLYIRHMLYKGNS